MRLARAGRLRSGGGCRRGGAAAAAAAFLRGPLDAVLRAGALGTIGLAGHVLAVLGVALDIEEVPDLVEGLAGAGHGRGGAVALLQGIGDLLERVGLGGGRLDAGVGEELVGVELLEQRDRLVEEVDDLLLRLVVLVALGAERGHARAVLAPLVGPEGLVLALVVLPVLVHVVQEGLVLGSDDGRDVGVLALLVAVGLISAVAVIRPQAVDSPRVRRAVTQIPELGLQDLAAGRVEAARVLDGGRVVARQRALVGHGAVLGLASEGHAAEHGGAQSERPEGGHSESKPWELVGFWPRVCSRLRRGNKASGSNDGEYICANRCAQAMSQSQPQCLIPPTAPSDVDARLAGRRAGEPRAQTDRSLPAEPAARPGSE